MSPLPECRPADVQPPIVSTQGLDDQVHVRVPFVGIKHHRVAVLESKFLPGEVLDRGQYLLRRRPRRHREHKLLRQLRRVARAAGLQIRDMTVLVQIQIPVVQQLGFDLEALTLVGLDIKSALSGQGVEIAATAPSSALLGSGL